MSTVDSTAGLSEAKRALIEQRLRRSITTPAATAIPCRPAGTVPPLSYAQERIWFMEQFAPGTAAYGVPLMIRLGSDADLDAFSAALSELAARHESLRMRFPATEDGRPTVVIDPPGQIALPVVEVADEAGALAAMDAAAIAGFDLARGPLLRAQVIRIADGAEHLALVDMHHIVTDGWSNDVILTELGQLYSAARAGTSAGLPAAVQYGDFAGWQREQMALPAAGRHLDYWLKQLKGVPSLELPTDAPRPPTQSFTGQSHHFRLDADLVTGLTALGRAHRATLFMTVLAAYQVMLSRYSGQIDFTTGSPVAGRSHPDLDGVVGMFNNMLPIRADLRGQPTGAQLVQRVRDNVLDALNHQDVPFEKVINELGIVRDVSRSALFQAMFVLQNYELRDNGGAGGAATLEWRPVDLPATRFDLELHAYPTGDGGLACRFVYNTALFEAGTAARLAHALQALLRDLVARPEVAVDDLELVDESERALLRRWNSTETAARPATTLPRLLAEQVHRSPDAVAVVDDNGALTYAELDRAANRIAHQLRAAGVGAESIVAVCADRSIDLVTGLVGVLKSGAAYLPLDPEYPVDRLNYMLADSGAAVVLAQRHLTDRLPAATTTLFFDELSRSTGPDDPLELVGSSDAAAYLIYTSGSTGRPKGVVNSHRGIINRLDWMQSAFGLQADDTVLQKTPASFDVSVWEFFWPLLTGARLVLARPGGHRDPGYLRETIALHRVTTVHFVPSMLTAFLADGVATGDSVSFTRQCASLRRVVCSGEELPAEVARRCVELLPQVDLRNLYGPTEAAVDVTAWRCTPATLAGRARVPIGVPIANVRIHVLDPRGREVPIGATGELHIGGVQVARGYHRRPSLTAERFVPDPFGPPGSRLYATGDLARWRPDGTVDYLGRIDGQVKVRGLRIELGEIETVLREQPGIREAAVAVKEPTAGDKRICAYVISDREPDVAALREALKSRLPDYMVPAAFVSLTELPLSPAGKLDRGALPVPDLAGSSQQAFVEASSELERAIVDIWRAVLGIERIGIDDDFFALGGHSLLATQVVARLRALTDGTDRRVGVMDLFQNPTVRGLAALIADESAGDRPRRLLYELTKATPGTTRVCSYVCVPYGGGSAVVYQPLADALPMGHALYSVAIPGHDVGLDEDSLPFDELARRCADEVLERVSGPLVLYGHCGVGGALITELARLLEASGREVTAVYVGGVFPFAKPQGLLTRFHAWLEDLGSNRNQANWLKSMGVDMSELEPRQADRIISNMRHDGKSAEAHFTRLMATEPQRLRAPIISVVGERDPITDYYQERYREWRFLTDSAALIVLDEAGHFFLKHRADDLVEIITTAHLRLDEVTAEPVVPEPRPRWWLESVARASDTADPGRPVEPSMRRFAAVALGQLVSVTGSSLTAWAIPIWLYVSTGSLLWFGLSGVFAIVPILLATPLAGAVADRANRRLVIATAAAVAASVQVGFIALLWTGRSSVSLVYLAVWLLSFAGTFQRVAFTAAIPQLVPKRFLGHANGVAQLINGVALLFVPLLAAGLLAAIELEGILLIDIASYIFALTVLAMVKFPDLLGRKRKETFGEQVLGGVRLTWGTPAFRHMLFFFGIGNLLYAAPVLMVVPLVLAFGTMGQVGQIALAEGVGALVGGLVITIWGGPRRRRMITNILAIATAGVFVMITGLRPSMSLVVVGVFGTGLALAIANGIYMTIIQVKVPQRFHGRVIALNQTITWSTLPIGFALLLPAAGALEPLLAPDGQLANSVGVLIGVGEGRGLGLAFVILGALMAVNALAWLRVSTLSRLDTDLPDSLPDDLIGAQAIADRPTRSAPALANREPERVGATRD